MDYACIEQDNEVDLQKGVDSLIGYAAQSNYFLIPVFPAADAIKAFVEATHPMQLVNYGNRAWCRLEVYVFSCLVEIMGREINCFGYGLHMPSLKASAVISEDLMTTGRSGRGEASTLGGSLVNFFLKPSSKERLVPLFGHNNGALFAKTYMPSSGDLTVENDRSVVRGIETTIQQGYTTMAIKKEIQRLKNWDGQTTHSTPTKTKRNTSLRSFMKQSSSPKSGSRISSFSRPGSFTGFSPASFSRGLKKMKSTVGAGMQELTEDGTDKRVCGLASKQIHDADVKVLTESLQGDLVTNLRNENIPQGQIRKLVLRDNMLTDKGVKAILIDYITAQEGGGRQVEIIDLGGNPCGMNGAMLFSRILVSGGDKCALKKLSLASTGLGASGIIAVASWLGNATQLVELDLSGNGEFGVAAMGALVGAAEEHGHLFVTVDDEAMAMLPRQLVERFEKANKSNLLESLMTTL